MADTPGVFKYAVVEIDTVDYAEYATTALVTGDAPTQILRTLVPDGQITDIDSTVHTFQLAGAQGTALHTALVAAEGTVVDVVFQAEFGAGKAVRTFTWTVPPIPFGGQQGAFRVFDVSAPTGPVANSVSS